MDPHPIPEMIYVTVFYQDLTASTVHRAVVETNTYLPAFTGVAFGFLFLLGIRDL